MKTVAGLFLVLAWFSLAAAADKTRELQEDDIREAVFRQHLDKTSHWAAVYFLQVNGGDPSDELLQRFADHKPPVRKASATTQRRDGGFFDEQTGRQGSLLFIDGIMWKSDTEAEVKAGCYNGPRAATWYVVTLKKEREKWRVVARKIRRLA